MTARWTSAVLCSAFSLSLLPAVAQNATSGGDQRPQQDAQSMRTGRRGGATRGTVVSVSGPNVVLKDESGTTWTVITTENTRIMRGQGTLAVSAIQPGDSVVSMGMPDADKHELHAMMLMDIPAADVAKAKANLGKTYIVGRITAIDETKLTILRSDKVTQTILLDESTSLHRGGRMDPAALQAAGLDGGMIGMGGGFGGGGFGGRNGGGGNGAGRRAANGGTPPDAAGEAITLADVKTGDTVVGLGSVKGGTFTPTDLRVQTPRANRPGANGATPPPQ